MDATSLLHTHSSKLKIINIEARGELMGRCHGHIKSVIYIQFGEGNMIFCDCEDALDRRNGGQWLAVAIR